jgi:hypothetical protein
MKNVRSKVWKNQVQTGLYIVGTALLLLGRAGFFNRPTTWAILIATVSAVYGFRHYTRMRYRDYVYEPMRPEQLPSDTYAMFNSRTPEFMQLGCGLVGDFRLAYAPYPVFVRYLLPPDRRVKGEACDWDGKFSLSFTSYFSDGRLLESVITAESSQKVSNFSKLWFFKCGPVSVAQLYERHREAIDAYEQSHQVSALEVTPSRLAEFSQYGHRLVWSEKGLLPKHLSEPRLADMQVKSFEAVTA